MIPPIPKSTNVEGNQLVIFTSFSYRKKEISQDIVSIPYSIDFWDLVLQVLDQRYIVAKAYVYIGIASGSP